MSRYLSFATDTQRPLDIQALLEAGFFAPNHRAQEPTRNDIGSSQFGLDDFSRETGIAENDLTRFMRSTEQQLETDPELLEELNKIREQMGLPPIKNAKQAGLDNLLGMSPEDLTALMVMWALQQEAKRNGGSGGGRDLGRMTSNPASITPASPSSWGGSQGGSSMGGGGGGSSGVTPSGRASNADMTAPASMNNLPRGDKGAGTFLDKALAQNGDRYVWGAGRSGGADPDSFDCSGLVIWACQQAGVTPPGATAEQVAANAPRISTEEALRTPGALLFRDGHVGISLGNGEVLHAKGSQWGVVREQTNASEWSGGGLIAGMNYGGSVGTA